MLGWGPKISGPQQGPAERGHVKKRQKSSKGVKNIFDTFRHFSRRAKCVKNRQKMSNIFSTLFDNFRAAPVFRPLLGGSERSSACPSKPGKSNFLGGISQDFAGISRRCPKSLRKSKFVFDYWPLDFLANCLLILFSGIFH